MPTDYGLIEELKKETGQEFYPLTSEMLAYVECYRKECHETAVCCVLIWSGNPEGSEGHFIQFCEGHARLHYDKEFQQRRELWRDKAWGWAYK